jgi:hypothetical protein
MNNKLIQVTATEGGFKWDTRHELTEWQQYSNQFKALGRGAPKMFSGSTYVRLKRPDEPQIVPIVYVKRYLPTHPYLRARMLHYGR